MTPVLEHQVAVYLNVAKKLIKENQERIEQLHREMMNPMLTLMNARNKEIHNV